MTAPAIGRDSKTEGTATTVPTDGFASSMQPAPAIVGSQVRPPGGRLGGPPRIGGEREQLDVADRFGGHRHARGHHPGLGTPNDRPRHLSPGGGPRLSFLSLPLALPTPAPR